jgi:trigger factor
MTVRIEDVSPVEKKMSVEIPWDVVSAKLGVAYKELGKGVALKGFRKGKVPRPVLEQVYGPRVQAEVAFQLVRDSFFKANAEHQLAAVAEPRIESGGLIKKGEPFAFAAIVEVRGEVKPKDVTGLPIERRRLSVKDETVEAAVEALRREHTELKPIEGRTVTQAGDVVALSITGTIGEHPVNQPQFAVDLDDAEREPLPGLRGALTGLAFDTKDKLIELTVPDDWREEPLRGRQAKLTVTISEVRAKDIPALDDEFAKDTGKGDTMDAVRAAIRKELEDRETEQITREARQNVLRALVKANQIPVANSLVERAIEVQYGRLRQMLGMKPEQGEPQIPPDLKEKMRPSGADEIRGQLLMEAIADAEKLTVSEAELDAHIATAAKARNQAPARVKSEWQREGRLDGVRYQLRQDKVLDFLVSKAVITEVDQLTPPAGSAGGEPSAAEIAALPHGAPGHVHGPDCDH